MKVLASADVHGVRPVYDWLLNIAAERQVDAIILAGDLLGCLDGFDTPEDAQTREAALLVNLLDSASIPVFYIMGNDDLVDLNSSSAAVQSIHARRVEFGDVNLVGYQYSLPFMGGTFEKPETSIHADLASLACLFDADTVFVSHSPAFGILDPGFGDAPIGSHSLRALLDHNPFLAHLHGHSHAGFGRFGKHFNVASAGRARATILDLSTMEHEFIGHG
jgi:Icc-related predicted phosphoesterase